MSNSVFNYPSKIETFHGLENSQFKRECFIMALLKMI